MSDLPNGWAYSSIGDLADYIQRGKSPKYTNNSELPIINQKCIRWNGLEIQHLKFIHPDQFTSWDKARYVVPGDILWNSTGTGTVGRAYILQETDCTPPKVVDSHVTIVRTNLNIDPRYVFNWIKGTVVQSKIADMCDGTTNQIELSRTAISLTEIPLAPANEQKRIADKLDSLLARIDACRGRLDILPVLIKQFRQSVLAAATSGRLTEDWRAKTKDDNWNVVQLGLVAEGFSYGTSSKSSKTGAVPVLRMGNIQNGQLDWSDLVFTSDKAEIQKYLLKSGDVLFNRTNSPELVGKTAIYKGEMKAIYAGYLIRVRCGESLLPEYLNYNLNSISGREYCWRVKSDGVSQSNINAKKLADFTFSMPSLDEQAEIIRRVETLFSIADRVDARIADARVKADTLTPSALAKAFRGELVPQDPNDEPASVLLERIRSKRNVLPVKKSSGRRKSRLI